MLQFKCMLWDFPCSPVVKILHFYCRGHGFDSQFGNWNPTGLRRAGVGGGGGAESMFGQILHQWYLSVHFSHSVVSHSLQPYGLQHARPSSPSPTHRACSNSYPSSWWWIQLSHPLPSPSPPALSLSQYQGLFQWVSSLHQVAKVLEFELQH